MIKLITVKKVLLSLFVILLLVLTVVLSRQTNASSMSQNNCGKSGQTYLIKIKDNHVSPENSYAKKCDKLTFINSDKVSRLIAFGPHEEHQAYDGISEKILKYNQSFSINLNQTGLYHFHDHLDDSVSGYFSVSQN